MPESGRSSCEYLADEHEINLNAVLSELCEWALSDDEDKEQFKISGWMKPIRQKEKLKNKQELQEKKPPRKKKKTKKNLKRNPTNTETNHKTR